MLIALDNGHGIETPGKRSPDGLFREYAWTRAFTKQLSNKLSSFHIPTFLAVPEEEDISIKERCNRINKRNPTFCISVHNNAFKEDWNSANGWSVHLDPVCSETSKMIATTFTNVAEEWGLNVRKPSHQTSYWTQRLGICRMTRCPTILTENLFMTNRLDVVRLNDPKFVKKLVSMYSYAILQCLKLYF